MIQLDDIEVLVGVGVYLIRPLTYCDLFAHVGNGQYDFNRARRFRTNLNLRYGGLESLSSRLDLVSAHRHTAEPKLAFLIGCV